MLMKQRNSGTVRLLGAEIVKVDEFKYLELIVQSNGDCRKECRIECRQGGAGGEKWQESSATGGYPQK